MDILTSNKDIYSHAKPELARVIHTDLKLNVDFENNVLQGTAILTIKRKPTINVLILDTYKLEITRVTNVSKGLSLRFVTLVQQNVEFDHHIGYAFYINLPIARKKDGECKIQIEYKTDPESPSLRWLMPEQTADGLHPFLLSYNKLIYARAMFPCQDTPSVKFTYSAEISVPSNYTVLMSAHLQDVSIYKYRRLAVYKFNQRKPVPSYAVIIAVGVLKKRQLSERSNVFAENKFIDESFNTFQSGTIESTLKIAESLCGPYEWDRYDVCVLPPSIAHFKIECPCVAFISPALLRGDQSGISYSLAWNISLNWAGNLVTCANYNHLWLNKSFCIFIARQILCKMSIYEEMKEFLRIEGAKNLDNMVRKFENTRWMLRRLLPNFSHEDKFPHKAIKCVPYESGYVLLCTLENWLGSSEFESFLQSYFKKFAFKSINTEDWKNYLCQYFSDKKVLNNFLWWTWFDVRPAFEIWNWTEKTAWDRECRELANEWIQFNATSSFPIIVERRNLCDVQKILFLSNLYTFHTSGLTEEKLKLISDFYSFDKDSGQIRFNWLLLCIKARWFEKVTTALDFAIKFCSPNIACTIFDRLYEWIEIRSRVIETYNRHKGKMLHKTQMKIEEILHLN
ncbi:leukotriene A-4 hydrolase-like [Temnothorax longispinosus]|uniref:leukotriene A-4 hydrolase-like n=1 Tax=Temnothorax longispinosus TaxID=300112 RepID=UPI003A999014